MCYFVLFVFSPRFVCICPLCVSCVTLDPSAGHTCMIGLFALMLALCVSAFFLTCLPPGLLCAVLLSIHQLDVCIIGTHRTYTSTQQPCVFSALFLSHLCLVLRLFFLCRPCVGSSAGHLIELNSFYTSKNKPCPLGTRACALSACLFLFNLSSFISFLSISVFVFQFSSDLSFSFLGCIHTYVPLLMISIRNTTYVMICTMAMLLVLCGCKGYGMVHDSSLVLFSCVLALRCTYYFFSILFSSIEMFFFSNMFCHHGRATT